MKKSELKQLILKEVRNVLNEVDMTKFYDGFVILDSKHQKTYKFKYVKGISNVKVENAAIDKLAKSTGLSKANFAVHGFVKKGEWNKSTVPTFESVLNKAAVDIIRSPEQKFHSSRYNSITEGYVQIFSLAKPYDKSDATKLRAAADDYIKFLQSKNYTTYTGADAVYFPDFTWGEKIQSQQWIGVLVGSDTMVMTPIGENREFKFGESLLSRLISNGRFDAYLLKAH